jgi:hypothetical protein
MIFKALHDDKYILVSSLDLSSAFDVVNIDLLLKRIRIIALPKNIITFFVVWLKKRVY